MRPLCLSHRTQVQSPNPKENLVESFSDNAVESNYEAIDVPQGACLIPAKLNMAAFRSELASAVAYVNNARQNQQG